MFHGSIVALVTPMDDRGGVDFAALRRLLAHQLDGGTSGIVICGTTGESPTVTAEEFSGILQCTVEEVAGRVPVIAGTGTPDTARTIERTSRAADLGADAALVVTPYYNRPMQSGLVAHFRAVADRSPIPLILYNVPTRTALDMLPQTVAELAGHERIVAFKESVGERGRVAEVIQRCGRDLAVLSGDDARCLVAMQEGATGVISVAANVVPSHMSRLCAVAAEGRAEEAEALSGELGELFGALTVETNPIPVKWAASRMGLIGPGIRLPLLPLAQEHRPVVEAALAKLGLLPAT